MADEVELSGGKLIHRKITDKINAKIEKGKLAAVHAIVVHQTGSSTAGSSLSSYEGGANGAHFLIDTDGTIYQTARIDQKCWHVGEIRSRCNELKTCSADELAKINALLFKKGEAYAIRIGNLHRHEAEKSYPERYPVNEDSIGIEIVGSFNADKKSYDTVTKEQNDSLVWLVGVLQDKLSLGSGNVYTHGNIGYKEPTEGSTAKWTAP